MCVVAALFGAGERAAAQQGSNNCNFTGPGPYTGTGVPPGTGAPFPASASYDSMFSMGVFQIQLNPSIPGIATLFAANGPLAAYPGYNPNTIPPTVTSPILYDIPSGPYLGTVIGRSAVQALPLPPTPFSPPIAIGGAPVSVDNITSLGGFFQPTLFEFASPTTREVLTEIQSFTLSLYPGYYNTGSSAPCGCAVPNQTPCFNYTGTSPINMVYAGYYNTTSPGSIGTVLSSLAPLPRSYGIVQSEQNNETISGITYNQGVGNSEWDFPANSFFGVFVQVTLPQIVPAAFGGLSTASQNIFPTEGAILYSDPTKPLIIQDVPPNSTLDQPLCALPPAVVYVHGGNTFAPGLYFAENNGTYWSAGELLGNVTLAGHGTFGPCDPEAQLVAAVLGTPGNANQPMPIGYPFPNTQFPYPGISYNSIYGVNISNQTLDAVTFFPAGIPVYLRNMSLDGFVNPINLPSSGNSVMYTNTNTLVAFELSLDGTNYSSASGSGAFVIELTNPGPVGNTTTYAMQVLQLTLDSSSEYGEIYLRQSTATNSVGKHIVQSSSQGGPLIGSSFNENFQLSTDNENWYARQPRSLPGTGQRALRGGGGAITCRAFWFQCGSYMAGVRLRTPRQRQLAATQLGQH